MKPSPILFVAVLLGLSLSAHAVEVVYLAPKEKIATVRCDDGSYRSADSIEAAVALCPKVRA